MRRSFHYSGADTYYPGGGWFICDVCSQRHRRTEMLVRWDNLRVDAKCLDPRPPQMQPPNVYPEGIPFPDTRSPQDRSDRLVDDTALESIMGGLKVQFGQTYPDGQDQQPGALSPAPITENIGGVDSLKLLGTEANNYLVTEGDLGIMVEVAGTPFGPNVLADDVTFLTGLVAAPDNSNSTKPDPVPAPKP